MPAADKQLSAEIEHWRTPKGRRAAIAALAIIILIGAVTGLVYSTGGTVFAWLHLMYVPILLAAAAFRVPGGIIAALIAGLTLGPFMPLYVPKGIPQEPLNWVFRIAFFVLVGTLSGLIAKWLNDQLDLVKRQSRFDLLTGLPNLLSLEERLQKVLQRKKDREQPVFLAILNIANIAEIVETLGYRSENSLIRQVATRLAGAGPVQDNVFKLHNNIFAFLSTDKGLDAFIEQCNWIAHLLKEPFLFENIPVSINMYFGIAGAEADAAKAHEAIQKASIAARIAESRRILSSVYSKEDDTCSVQRLSLLGTLNDAIKNAELELYYQPKVSMKGNTVVGAETLMRWHHPKQGMIPPDMYLPAAENTWLAHPLALFALEAALVKLRQFAEKGMSIKLAINLTAHNVQDRTMIAELVEMIKKSGVNAANLEIEIMERSLVTDMQSAAEALRSLKSIGASIAIDDFGTGYSTASYIQNLPVDAVKIDQSLIMNLGSSKLSRTLVGRIIEAARELGLTTIAEGVESEEIYNTLHDLGCDIAQGYYISRPLADHDFSAWLESSPWRVGQRETCRNPNNEVSP